MGLREGLREAVRAQGKRSAVVLAAGLMCFASAGGAGAQPSAEAAATTVYRNLATGHCLDSNGRDVYPHSCNGGSYQKWAVSSSGGTVTLRNLATGHCLDSNGRDVYPHSCNGGSYQKWTVSSSGGTVTLRNLATGHCLDSNGRDVYPHSCNGGSYQKWTPTG
ncbi:RICIN domain-containing protein [Streptomyces pactum]|nr:RICIN domain-containing protein [Streptomyces pactum]